MIPGHKVGEIEVFILTPKELPELFARYKGTLEVFIGFTQTPASGITLQVNNHESSNWTMFNAVEKQ